MIIEDLMTRDVVTTAPDRPFSEVLRLMSDGPLSCVPVCKNDSVVGIVTERDVVRVCATQSAADQANLEVSQVMNAPVIAVCNDNEIETALEVACSCEIRHLPVVDHSDHLVGIVTQSDLVMRYLYMLFEETTQTS